MGALKVCVHCGATNQDTAKFCRKCGAALEGNEKLPGDVEQKTSSIETEPGTTHASGNCLEIPHKDPVCPYCGSDQCQPVSRTRAKTHRKGFCLSNSCCGMCLLGPFGLLCGLCGTGSKTDIHNEVVWVCKSCGKEHLSQKDALEKLEITAASYMLSILLVAVLLSLWHMGGGLHWFFWLAWLSAPFIAVEMIDDEISSELGYSVAELPAVEKVVLPCFFGAIAATLIALLAGGPVVSSLLELWMGA